MFSRARKAVAAIGALLGQVVDEILVAAALALIAVGLWDVWRPGVFIVPGVVLLWVALPTRASFVARPPVKPPRRAD